MLVLVLAGTGASPAIAAVGPGATASPAVAAVAASLQNALLTHNKTAC